MRLLLDQNLWPRLLDILADLYPGSTHVRNQGLQAADDDTVWADAARHGFIIVSKASPMSCGIDASSPSKSRGSNGSRGQRVCGPLRRTRHFRRGLPATVALITLSPIRDSIASKGAAIPRRATELWARSAARGWPAAGPPGFGSSAKLTDLPVDVSGRVIAFRDG